jgi:hypothetical protein
VEEFFNRIGRSATLTKTRESTLSGRYYERIVGYGPVVLAEYLTTASAACPRVSRGRPSELNYPSQAIL